MPKVFLADRTVGRLAKWLRLLGYDCIFSDSIEKQEVLLRSKQDKRILLTRDEKLVAMAGSNVEIVLLKSNDSFEQLKYIINKYSLSIQCKSFLSTCSVCNVPLEDIAREKARGIVPPYVYRTRKTFRRCPQCHRFYWAGTHKSRMIDQLRRVLDNEPTSRSDNGS